MNSLPKIVEVYLSMLQINPMVFGKLRVSFNWGEKEHVTEFNRIYYITGGEGRIKIDGNEYFPKPGQLFLLPMGRKLEFSLINNNPLEKYFCHFTATVGGTSLFDLIQLPYVIEIENQEYVTALFDKLISNYMNRSLEGQLLLKSVLLEMMALIIKGSSIDLRKIESYRTVETINKVLQYIDRHLSEEISIGQLSELIHLHPNYFMSFFKKHVGYSPVQYITHTRLSKAKLLLETTELSVSEIASMTGYKDANYFSNTFRKHMGIAPSDVRKEYKDISKKKITIKEDNYKRR